METGRYHINPNTGRVETCNANVGPCPFQLLSEHFNNTEDAQKYADRLNEEIIIGEGEIYNFYQTDEQEYKYFRLKQLAESTSFLSRIEAIRNGYYTDRFLYDDNPRVKIELLRLGLGSVELSMDANPHIAKEAKKLDLKIEKNDRQIIEKYKEDRNEFEKTSNKPFKVSSNVRDALTRQEIRNTTGHQIIERDRAFRISVSNGGISYDPINNRMMTAGFFMSGYAEFSECVDKEEYTEDVFNNYIEKNKDFLQNNPGTLVGIWVDNESGKVFLDISQRTLNSKYAEQVCAENDQIAYFDLTLFEEVIVNRKATSGGKV